MASSLWLEPGAPGWSLTLMKTHTLTPPGLPEVRPGGSALRVLHLEDDPHDHYMVREWMRDNDFAVEFTLVNNQRDFSDGFWNRCPLRPHSFGQDPSRALTGLSALRLVREGYGQIPFIFVTGSMGEEAAIETMKEGGDRLCPEGRTQAADSGGGNGRWRDAERSKESRQAEDKIRQQAAIIDTAQDAILVTDAEEHVLFWNASAERIYGWTAPEIIGRKVTDLLTKDRTKYHEAKQILVEKGSWTGEMNKVDRAGNELTVECRWTLVRDPNGLPKTIVRIDTDVTEKKSIETQLLRAQRLESVGSLASGIAHDLNNCLAPVLMGVAVLKELVSDPSVQKILSAMESSATRGAGVVKQVLTFARGGTDDRTIVQPNHLIQEIVKIIRETFPRNVQINAECAPHLWTIESNATQFHQVLLNLCVNARDAMPEGGTLTL